MFPAGKVNSKIMRKILNDLRPEQCIFLRSRNQIQIRIYNLLDIIPRSPCIHFIFVQINRSCAPYYLE